MKTLPATILSGFTGAGKTAVIRHLLKNLPGMQIAIIADFANYETLAEQVTELSKSGQYDYVLIESKGFSEPTELSDAFSSINNVGSSALCGTAKIDTMVTVVDAETFLDDFQSTEELRDRGIGRDAEDDRDVVRVLIDQVEFANVILLNKTDLVSKEESEQLLALLKKFNPDARVLGIDHGQVPAEEVVNTGIFQREWAPGADAWQSMLSSDETDAFGISSFVYRARRPFHPQRFWDFWMGGEHAVNILRSKGYFWLATKNATSGFWSHAGQVLAAEPGGTWWAETPRANWPKDDPELLAELDSVWDKVWGDRRQELIIIGQDLNATAVRSALDACLLSDREMESGLKSWMNLQDPFGAWEESPSCSSGHEHD